MSDDLLARANSAIGEFLESDPLKISEAEWGRRYQKANIGLRVRHDEIVNARIEIDQKLRAISMAFAKPEIREEYIRHTSPKMLPDIKKSA
jgi:hypothetical protein